MLWSPHHRDLALRHYTTTPESLFGPYLVHWYRADDTGISFNGGNVSIWPNRGPGRGTQASVVQAVSGLQPIFSATGFNGGPMVSGQKLAARTLKTNVLVNYGGSQGWSFWAVVKFATATGGCFIWSLGASSTNTYNVTHSGASLGVTIANNADLVGGSDNIAGPTQDTGRHLISGITKTTTTGKFRCDDLSYNGTRTTGLGSSIQTLSFFAGLAGTSPGDDSIVEFIAIDRIASASEDLQMRKYFLRHPSNSYYGLSYTP